MQLNCEERVACMLTKYVNNLPRHERNFWLMAQHCNLALQGREKWASSSPQVPRLRESGRKESSRQAALKSQRERKTEGGCVSLPPMHIIPSTRGEGISTGKTISLKYPNKEHMKGRKGIKLITQKWIRNTGGKGCAALTQLEEPSRQIPSLSALVH